MYSSVKILIIKSQETSFHRRLPTKPPSLNNRGANMIVRYQSPRLEGTVNAHDAYTI